MMETSERLCYSCREVAQLLNLSRNSVYQGVLTGEIPHIKVGKRVLIPRVQLERLLLGNSEAKEVRNG